MDLNNRRTGKDATKPRALGLLGHSDTVTLTFIDNNFVKYDADGKMGLDVMGWTRSAYMDRKTGGSYFTQKFVCGCTFFGGIHVLMSSCDGRYHHLPTTHCNCMVALI